MYDDFSALKYISIAFGIIVVFAWFVFLFGDITIQITGKPQIDALNSQLAQCQKDLSTMREIKIPECRCVYFNPNFELGILIFVAGFIVGMIILNEYRAYKNKKSEEKNVKRT
jgi:hypothetical protein